MERPLNFASRSLADRAAFPAQILCLDIIEINEPLNIESARALSLLALLKGIFRDGHLRQLSKGVFCVKVNHGVKAVKNLMVL